MTAINSFLEAQKILEAEGGPFGALATHHEESPPASNWRALSLLLSESMYEEILIHLLTLDLVQAFTFAGRAGHPAFLYFRGLGYIHYTQVDELVSWAKQEFDNI